MCRTYHITEVMWYFSFHETQAVDLALVLPTAGAGVDPGGVDAGMAQYVRQADDIPFHSIKKPGKQVPQVMGEDLLLRHPRRGA